MKLRTLLLVSLSLIYPIFSFASFFPTQGQMSYLMVHEPVEGDEGPVVGEFLLEALSSKETVNGVETEYRSSSTTFPEYQFFTISEDSEIHINGMTYIGPGSDEVSGESYALVSKSMEIGSRQDYPLMLSKVLNVENVALVDGTVVQAHRIELIGTNGNYYTMAGNYWLVDGMGIVKASYTTVDGRNVELLLNSVP